jgi:hypothetical protein
MKQAAFLWGTADGSNNKDIFCYSDGSFEAVSGWRCLSRTGVVGRDMTDPLLTLLSVIGLIGLSALGYQLYMCLKRPEKAMLFSRRLKTSFGGWCWLALISLSWAGLIFAGSYTLMSGLPFDEGPIAGIAAAITFWSFPVFVGIDRMAYELLSRRNDSELAKETRRLALEPLPARREKIVNEDELKLSKSSLNARFPSPMERLRKEIQIREDHAYQLGPAEGMQTMNQGQALDSRVMGARKI